MLVCEVGSKSEFYSDLSLFSSAYSVYLPTKKSIYALVVNVFGEGVNLFGEGVYIHALAMNRFLAERNCNTLNTNVINNGEN